MNMHLKNIHLNKMNKKQVITSAAIATAALGALGAAAYAWKRHKIAAQQDGHASPRGASDDIGPGEINPYADTPTDPANQN